jgi:hypothetical protein
MDPAPRIGLVEPNLGFSISHCERPAPSTRNRLKVISPHANQWVLSGVGEVSGSFEWPAEVPGQFVSAPRMLLRKALS